MISLPWEMVAEILSWLPLKSLARFRTVCKRLNTLCKDKIFANNHLARGCRPQFILFFESKTCSVEVHLNDVPSIKVHKLPLDIDIDKRVTNFTVDYCDGLLLCATGFVIAVSNPWLKQTKWDQNLQVSPYYCGIGYDTSRSDKHHKIFVSDQINNTVMAWITEFGSDAGKRCNFESENWMFLSNHSVSLNGNLYWVAHYCQPHEYFIQSFEFSIERFKPLCVLPGINSVDHAEYRRSLAVFRGDQFSFLEQAYFKRSKNIDIWVTTRKINNEEGVQWIKFMNVSVPEWSCLRFTGVHYDHPPSYFIDDESRSLVICYWDDNGEAYIYIAKEDRFYDIKIDDSLFEYKPHHHTYFPSLVQVPSYRKEY